MEQKLPVIFIEGAAFDVDVKEQLLRDRHIPKNTISFLDMVDHGTHYALRFDPNSKNLPGFFDDSIIVEVPQMVDLDPAGMAEKYGMTVDQLKGKSDFDVIVNQELVQRRENGLLPVIEIEGHPFYVDVRVGSLRPKDDFRTMGIEFSAIEDCLQEDGGYYLIPYDPQKHEYVELDYSTIVAVPKNVVVVEIPNEIQLDPIGFARKHGLDQKQVLREFPPVDGMKARLVPWTETPLNYIIQENKKMSERNAASAPKQKKTMKRRGRRL